MQIGKKRMLIVYFFGITLLMFSIMLPEALYEKCILLNGPQGMDKTVVQLKLTGRMNGKLTPAGIKKVAKELDTAAYTYTAVNPLLTVNLKSNLLAVNAKITGTNSRLPEFRKMDFMEGSFFTGAAETEDRNVAVIDDALAWNLFRTYKAVGKTIEINGQKFKVTGIFKRDRSVIGKLCRDELPEVLMPAQKLFNIDKNARIISLQFAVNAESTMDGAANEIERTLLASGLNKDEFIIEEYKMESALLKQTPQIIVFLLGCFIILLFAGGSIRTVRAIMAHFRSNCRNNDVFKVIAENWYYPARESVKVIVWIAAGIAIFTAIRFKLFIPLQYIPEELTDISFFLNMIGSGIQEGLQGQLYVKDSTALILECTRFLSGITAFPAAIAGIFSINLSLHVLAKYFSLSRLTLFSGIIASISFAAAAVSAEALGLVLSLNIVHVLVVWAFIYVILQNKKYKTEGMN